MRTFTQVFSILRPQYSATTSRQNATRAAAELVKNRLLNIPKPVLTFPFEILTNRAAKLLLYFVVRIKERKPEPSGKLTPDGGFSRAWKADQADHTHKPDFKIRMGKLVMCRV